MRESKRLLLALQDAMNKTLEMLDGLEEQHLDQPCSHGCAMGNGVRGLLVHNIEHERAHAGQVASIRFELKAMQDQSVHRLLAEWMRERASLAALLIGLPDEALDAKWREGEWSIREIVEHVLYWEKDSVEHLANELTLKQTFPQTK
jgi:uncharacterized damage-inducible protein DinB